MPALRKALSFLVVLLLLLAGGLVLAFLTVDVNQFRPLLVSKLTEATGRQVELASISRSWTGGLGLELRGLVVHEDRAFGATPFVSVEQATARLRLWPLLQRRVELATITLDHPAIRVIKNSAGQLNVMTLAPAASSGAPAAPPAAALPLLVSSLVITDADISYEDASVTPPMTAQLRGLDVTASSIAVVNGVPEATITVHDGTVTSSQLSHPIESLTAECRITADRLAFARAGARVGDGTLSATATVDGYRTPQPRMELSLKLDRLAVEQLLPPALAKAPQRVEGRLSGTVQATGTGLAWPQLAPSLDGQVALQLTDGRVTQLNVLREALVKLSMLPGLVEKLQTKLPERHRQLLAQDDTAIRRLDVTARIERGALLIDPLRVGTDVGDLRGRGRVGFDGSVDLETQIAVPPDLSAAIVRAVEELGALADAEGAITFPVAVRGTPPQIAVQPDVEYIAKRVVIAKGEALIGSLLERALGDQNKTPAPNAPAADPTAPTTTTTDTAPSATEQLLRELLGGQQP